MPRNAADHPTHVYLPGDAHHRVAALARELGISRSGAVRMLVLDGLRRREREQQRETTAR